MSLLAYQGTRAVTVPVTAAGASAPLISAPCRLKGWSLTSLGGKSTEADGTQNAPAANTVIANTAVVPAGDYSVAWTVELEGTVAAGTDNDNFQLRINSATAATSLNLAVAGEYPQASLTATVTPSGTVAVRNNLAGSVGSIYRAVIVLTPADPAAVTLLDGQQTIGQSSIPYGFSDTEFLDEEGIYVSTSIVMSVQFGSVNGCIYVKDFIESVKA